MVPITLNLRVELLCVHHSFRRFSSGNDGADEVVRQYEKATHSRNSDEFLAIVVAQPSGEVAGVASAVDVRLHGELDDAGNVVGGLCLFYPLLAVDTMYHGTKVREMLLDELAAVRDRRFHLRSDYIGEVAAPTLAKSGGLKRYLEKRGFKRLRTDEFWYRPR